MTEEWAEMARDRMDELGVQLRPLARELGTTHVTLFNVLHAKVDSSPHVAGICEFLGLPLPTDLESEADRQKRLQAADDVLRRYRPELAESPGRRRAAAAASVIESEDPMLLDRLLEMLEFHAADLERRKKK